MTSAARRENSRQGEIRSANGTLTSSCGFVAKPLKLFTGTASRPPRAPSGADDLAEDSTPDVVLALRVRGGRAARGPSEELEFTLHLRSFQNSQPEALTNRLTVIWLWESQLGGFFLR